MDIKKAAEESFRKQIQDRLRQVTCPKHGGYATLPRNFKALDGNAVKNIPVCCEELKAALVKAFK